MGKVLRSKEMDQIDELLKKVFDLNSNLVFFPVRHHSPACAYHLKKTIEEYSPEIILIEGPVDGNRIKEFLAHDESKAPFAIYYSYSDTKGYIDDKKEKYKCYYPFLNYSPELVALREGKKRNIETSFIDLPYSEILINSSEGKGLLKKGDKSNYNDDYLLEKSKFIEILCEEHGCRNFNELWEKLFEIEGLYISKESFVKNMFSYCYFSRLYSSYGELKEEGCLAREIFMASKIQEAMSNYNRILVVTGGFHTYGIMEILNKENNFKLHKYNKDDSSVYVMPYSMEAADQLNGYVSGMPFPFFYEGVWQRLEKEEGKPYENSVLYNIINCGRKIRKSDGSISTFDEICAFNMCKGLNELRDKRECGAYELIDGVMSSFIKGDLNISTESPLNILYKNLTGDIIGKLCDDADVPPIVNDFRQICHKYKLKSNTTLEQELVLEIFSSKRHREISCVLHRMVFLNTNFCKCIKGPNILLKKNTNLIRETWKYKWSTSVLSALIDVSVYGGTLKEAAISIVNKNINENSRNSGDISKILVEAFNMGLDEIFNSTLVSLRNIIVEDGNFYSLIDCLYYLNSIYIMSELYNMDFMDEVKNIIFSCYSKLSILIPGLSNSSEEESSKIVNSLKEIFNSVLNRDLRLDQTIFIEALKALLKFKEGNPGVEGAALGILYGLNEVKVSEISKTIESYILGTGDKLLKSPTFLNGLFSSAKDVVFIEPLILKSIDKFISKTNDEEFIKVIPELRLAFSYFAPKEIDEIAEEIAKVYGTKKENFLEAKNITPEILSLGLELNKYAVNVMKRGEIL